MRNWSMILLLCVTVGLVGCEKPARKAQDKTQKKMTTGSVEKKEMKKADAVVSEEAGFKPFYVYKDKGSRSNHYVPSGFMGSVSCIDFSDRWQEDCYSGSSCIKVDFDVECAIDSEEWGGIYWQNPANNWGNRKGGFNLEGAEKLTFWAKGESGGEQIEEITLGGITGDYPDSDKAVIGPIILSSEWKQYTIDLRGKDMSYINGGFSWTVNQEPNPEACVFYMDDIRYE